MNTLKAEIEELLYNNASDIEIAKAIKKDISLYFDTLEETFSHSGGKDFLVKHTKKIDTILKMVYRVAQREIFGNYSPMKNSIPLAMVALGSYGREQLCVHSDIDLMIVYKEIPGYNLKEMIEKILYILWDTGLKLGHRVHTVEELFEVSKTDITIKTAIVESRFIEGSNFIWTETQNSIAQIRHDDIKNFIALKFKEQEQKHHKFPLTMEPNLKEGVGGFRDANLVFWIGKILYNINKIKDLPDEIIDAKEYKSFRMSLEFLFRVRSALHLTTHKKEDRLRLDLIPNIAKLLGYEESKQGHMKFAKKVTASLKIIRLYSIIWIEKLTRDYVTVDEKKNYLYPSETDFNGLLGALCDHAQQSFTAHPTLLLKLIQSQKPERPDDEMYKTIAKIFYQPHCCPVLSTLSYARLLKYTIPPIKKVIDLPQFDGYHKFAVDIHSLRCLYHLEHIEDDLIKSLFDDLSADEKAMLKLVTFLHDAGKGRVKDHHEVGASLFKVFAERLQVKPSLIKMGEQLILHHTLMSKIAQREDLYNEKVILGFASHFKNKKLLDMIYILTYADMHGVGSDIYNSFSAKLIRTLYKQSLEVLDKSAMLDEASKRAKKEASLKRNKQFKALKTSQQKKILKIPSNLMFLKYKTQRILDISQKAFEMQEKAYEYLISNEEYLTIEIIRSDYLNLNHLFGKLGNLEVVNMDICKLFDGLKYFKIDFKEKIEKDEVGFLEEMIEGSFVRTEEKEFYSLKINKNEIDIDCHHSKNYAIMHLNTKNQKGLLMNVIGTFDEIGLDIVSAKIHTIKNRARDMFLIEKDGKFCHNTDKIIEKLTSK